MEISLVVLIVLLVVGIVIGILILLKAYAPPANSNGASTVPPSFVPSSPWMWDPRQNISSIPVDGASGQCSVYTFAAVDRFTPAVLGFDGIGACNGSNPDGSAVNSCVGSHPCACSPPQDGLTCVDDDQVFAQKRKHTCQAGILGVNFRTSGLCRQTDGTLVPPGTTEEYFVPCGPGSNAPLPNSSSDVPSYAQSGDNRCAGSIGLIAFNATLSTTGPAVLNSAVCLQEPAYTSSTDAEGKITFSDLNLISGSCDLRVNYRGYPSQLFRIQRADYSNGSYLANSNGRFVRLIHRPTGYMVTPTLDGDGSVRLSAPATLGPMPRKPTYPWLISPTLNINIPDLALAVSLYRGGNWDIFAIQLRMTGTDPGTATLAVQQLAVEAVRRMSTLTATDLGDLSPGASSQSLANEVRRNLSASLGTGKSLEVALRELGQGSRWRKLISTDQTIAMNSLREYWGLQVVPNLELSNLGSVPQLVYISKPEEVPAVGSDLNLLFYLAAPENRIGSLTPGDNGMEVVPYLSYNADPSDNTPNNQRARSAANAARVLLLDYAILPLTLQAPGHLE